MTRRLLAIAFAAVLIGTTASGAWASPKNRVTRVLRCDNGERITVEYVHPESSAALPNGLHIVDSTSNFVFHTLVVTDPETGEVVFEAINTGVDNNRQLTTCRYRSSSNFNITLTGFFTPQG